MYTVSNKSFLCDIFTTKEQAETYINTRQLRHTYTLTNTLEEISEGEYYYFLECLPPIYVSGFVFANSEPVTHYLRERNYTAIYRVCFQKGEKFYKFLSPLEDLKNFHPADVI